MKQIIKRLTLVSALILIFGIKVRAQQDPYYPLLLTELKVTGGDTLSDGYISLSDTTMYDTHMLISLYDTAAISKIHIVLRKNESSSDLMAQSFDFSSVLRNAYTVDLGLGSFPGMQHCYGEATLEMADGSLTQTFKVWK